MMVEKYIIQEVRQSLEEDLAKKRQEREDEMDYNRYEDEEEVIQFYPDVSPHSSTDQSYHLIRSS
jgi:hypothetical protein